MHLLLLSILSTISLSKHSLPFPLLSLTCTPSPSPSTQTNPNPMQTLLHNLTSLAPNTLFLSPPYSALMQCRPTLHPNRCTLCANAARLTILTLCSHAVAVSAWFDGCYAQIHPSTLPALPHHSCSPRFTNQHPDRFNPALQTLLLQLRADISIPTRHGFASGHISYEDSGEIEGAVECVMSLSARECDACVAKAIERVEIQCRGKDGGVAVGGSCLVRFHYNYRRRTAVAVAAAGTSGGLSSSAGCNVSGGWVGDGDSGKRKAVVAYCGGGFGCLLVVVFLVWLLKRAVLNRARIGALELDTLGKTTAQN